MRWSAYVLLGLAILLGVAGKFRFRPGRFPHPSVHMACLSCCPQSSRPRPYGSALT